MSETGSGKTLAYSLPIVHNLLESDSGEETHGALVLTPNRELAS